MANNIIVSPSVHSVMRAQNRAGIREAIGSVNYNYSTQTVNGTVTVMDVTSLPVYFETFLSNVYIGSRVTSLPDYAFDSIGSWTTEGFVGALTEVVMTDSVTSIGDLAFNHANNLTKVALSSNISVIPIHCFSKCSSLASITLPASLTDIYYESFAGCTSLQRIDILAPQAPTLHTEWEDEYSGTVYNFFVFSGFDGAVPSTCEIHVPADATGYGPTLEGLTVIKDL